MFNFFNNSVKPAENRERKLFSAASGTVVPLETVPDETFSKRMLGDGVAVIPSDDVIVSPADGLVSMLYPAGHAFGMVLPNGVELLVHIGVDTVSLKGAGFRRFADENDVVRAGDPIIKVNRRFLIAQGYNPVTILIVTAAQRYLFDFVKPGTKVKRGSIIASF